MTFTRQGQMPRGTTAQAEAGCAVVLRRPGEGAFRLTMSTRSGYRTDVASDSYWQHEETGTTGHTASPASWSGASFWLSWVAGEEWQNAHHSLGIW